MFSNLGDPFQLCIPYPKMAYSANLPCINSLQRNSNVNSRVAGNTRGMSRVVMLQGRHCHSCLFCNQMSAQPLGVSLENGFGMLNRAGFGNGRNLTGTSFLGEEESGV